MAVREVSGLEGDSWCWCDAGFCDTMFRGLKKKAAG